MEHARAFLRQRGAGLRQLEGLDPRRGLAQPRASHLPEVGSGQRLKKGPLARILVRFEPVPHERLQLFGQPLAALPYDHEGVRLDEPVLPENTDHRDLLDCRMLQQTVLHFLRRQPLARYLEQVVGPAAAGEIAIDVAPDHIARDVPLAQKSLLRLLHLLPVAQGARGAAHPQGTHFAVGQLAPRVIAHLDLEPRHDGPERPWAHVSWTIRDEDVPHLRRAETVQQLDAEGLLPAAIQVHRKRDRKSTRLNSSHLVISYAVFCLKKKKKKTPN